MEYLLRSCSYLTLNANYYRHDCLLPLEWLAKNLLRDESEQHDYPTKVTQYET